MKHLKDMNETQQKLFNALSATIQQFAKDNDFKTKDIVQVFEVVYTLVMAVKAQMLLTVTEKDIKEHEKK